MDRSYVTPLSKTHEVELMLSLTLWLQLYCPRSLSAVLGTAKRAGTAIGPQQERWRQSWKEEQLEGVQCVKSLF